MIYYSNMMGNYNNMMTGGYGGGLMTFGWIASLIIIVSIVLGIIALWKYINKK